MKELNSNEIAQVSVGLEPVTGVALFVAGAAVAVIGTLWCISSSIRPKF